MSEDERSHETTIEIVASTDAVWKAITDAADIVKWFAPEARVEPGVGGSIWVSWGHGMEGSSRIEIWEPGTHLRTVVEREGAKVVIDWYLETKAGCTALRIVHAGFGRGANWDDEYEGTKKGWPVFFRILKHSLEQHPGARSTQVVMTLPVQASPEEQWTRLFHGKLDGLSQGDAFTAQMPNGDELRGHVDILPSRGYLVSVVENWNNALMGVYCETSGGSGVLTVAFALFGPTVDEADAIRARWLPMLKEMFAA